MNRKWTSLSKLLKAAAASVALAGLTLVGGSALAQLSQQEQQAAQNLGGQITSAVQALLAANPNATAEQVQATIQNAIQASGVSPQVANAAMSTVAAQLGSVPGVQQAQATVLAAAITAAVEAAVAANEGASAETVQAAVEAAVSAQVTTSGAPPAVAQLAVQTAQASLPPAIAAIPGVQTAVNNVQTVVTAQATGSTQTAQTGTQTQTGQTTNTQPNVTPPPPPPTYVG
jgi:hypothetical protein